MKKYLILALPVLVASAACTKVEVQDTVEQAVTFNVVNYLHQTRAYNAYSTEDTFGTFAFFTQTDWETDGDGTVFIENEEVLYGPSYAEGEWGTATRYFWPKTAKLTFASYSPYVDAASAASKGFSAVPTYTKRDGFAFPRYKIVPETDVDLMVADLTTDQTANLSEYAVSSNTQGVPTLFRHQLTQVAVVFRSTENANPNVTGSEIVVKDVWLSNIRNEGSYTQNSDPVWSDQSGEVVYDFNPGGQLVLTEPGRDYYPSVRSRILLPQPLVRGYGFTQGQQLNVVFSIRSVFEDGRTVDGDEITSTVDLYSLDIPDWLPNMSVVYTITIDAVSQDPITFDPAIAEWSLTSAGNLTI
ncbi:MAG: fimbrillin family protein [Bacteroidales bacterium]|nr:fimbrillin family protein [Bacteroidales bacterium]